MNRNRKVVITGVGVVSPIGIGREAFWQSLTEGKSGVTVRDEFAQTDLPLKIAASVTNFEAKLYVKPRKALKIMCSPIQFGCAAAALAAEDAGLDKDTLDPERLGIVFGTETFYADPNEVADVFRKCTVDEDYQHEKWGEFAMREIQPLWMLKYLPNMAASHISIAMDARGPSNSICQGEASGLLALVEAADLIQRGDADTVIAGGTGSQMALTAMLYRGVSMLSKRIDEPEKASRPFDANRDGMVVGEGSGVLILESEEAAQQRGATVLATLEGWSRTHLDPSEENFGNTIQYCYQAALKSAGIDSDKIGLVNANALGSLELDRVEAEAIQREFGDTPVVAHKSNFGNIGPGTSTVELIGAVLSKHAAKIPASLNCDEVSDCPVNVNSKLSDLEAGKFVLKSSISSTGQVCSVVLG